MLCVTKAYQAALWADWVYACDPKWWNHYGPDVRARFHGERWTQRQPPQFNGTDYIPDEVACCEQFGLHWMPSATKVGLGEDCIHLSTGGSGYHAINLAYLFGATRIVLLGYDAGMTGGRKHFDGDDYPISVGESGGWAPGYREGYPALVKDLGRAGVELVNCSRATLLTAVTRQPLEEALCAL